MKNKILTNLVFSHIVCWSITVTAFLLVSFLFWESSLNWFTVRSAEFMSIILFLVSTVKDYFDKN